MYKHKSNYHKCLSLIITNIAHKSTLQTTWENKNPYNFTHGPQNQAIQQNFLNMIIFFSLSLSRKTIKTNTQ